MVSRRIRSPRISPRGFITRWNRFLGILDLAKAYAPAEVTEADFAAIRGILSDPNRYLEEQENRQELWASHVWRRLYKRLCRDEFVKRIPHRKTALDLFVDGSEGARTEAARRMACFAYPRYLLIQLRGAIDRSIAAISSSNTEIKAVLGTIDSLLSKCRKVDQNVARHLDLLKLAEDLAFRRRIIKSRAPSKLRLQQAVTFWRESYMNSFFAYHADGLLRRLGKKRMLISSQTGRKLRIFEINDIIWELEQALFSEPSKAESVKMQISRWKNNYFAKCDPQVQMPKYLSSK